MNFFEILNNKAKADGIAKRISGGIIINDRGEVLLLKRKSDDFMGGILELPSGNVEIDEKIEEGLIREVKEETNLNVTGIGMFVNTFDYLSRSGKKSRQFNFEIFVKDVSNIFLTEHDEYVWLTVEDIRRNDNITDEVKYAIEIFIYNKRKNIEDGKHAETI
ncbi:MAG: NUDIX hydrolase [Clostridia bacterium]|nr:NUDIX hydrolase [Clostridia bacterium]